MLALFFPVQLHAAAPTAATAGHKVFHHAYS